MTADLIVIAKEPKPGLVKTRLTTAYTAVQAALLARAALEDTLRAVAAAPARRRTLALAGEAGPWLPAGVEVIPQRGYGLGERLAAAFEDAYRGRPLVLIGMDTPQVTPALLAAAVTALESSGAVFGPAADGGFWLLGLRRPVHGLFEGVPMSCPETGERQLARLRAAGLEISTMPELTDVDTPADAVKVAAEAPGSRFAAVLRSLSVSADAG